MARVNRWSVSGGGNCKLVIIPRGKDIDEITGLIGLCFSSFDYEQETSGSFNHFLVYRCDGKIIALCSVYDKRSTHGFIMFGRLCVHPDFRGRHISHIILNYLKSKYPVLVWTTNNPELDKFYEKIGGKKTGVRDGLVYWKWTR